MFGYTPSGDDCVPTTSFNGSLVEIDFSDQSPRDASYTVCVMFRNKECSAISSTTVTGKNAYACMQVYHINDVVSFSSSYNDYRTRS